MTILFLDKVVSIYKNKTGKMHLPFIFKTGKIYTPKIAQSFDNVAIPNLAIVGITIVGVGE